MNKKFNRIINLVFNSAIAWLYFSLVFAISILYRKEISHISKLLLEGSGLIFFIIVFIKDRAKGKVTEVKFKQKMLQKYTSSSIYILLILTCTIIVFHFLNYEVPSIVAYIYWVFVLMYILINGVGRYVEYFKSRDSKHYFEFGLAKYKIKDYQSAVENYTEVIKLQPKHINSYFNRGLAKYHFGDYAGAILDYTKVIELAPDYADAYRHRGLTKYALGDYYGTIQDATKALYFNPLLERAYCDRGLGKSKLNDRQGAIEDFSKSIELKPSGIAYYNRGNEKLKLGDSQAGIEDYTKAIELTPDFAVAYFARGLIMSKLGDFSGARKDYTKAIELKPDFIEAIEAIKQSCPNNNLQKNE